ncbi:hypothetical protein WICPIJ_005121 [Wickerhamomyces pijperi]|uniref:Uncharacterized protein n=1 Tax=Wickerhamomyces pijperi TaxID=599730 RepID=A0A9P8Q4I7_WICPI|nr:hypothetical protein WICPIJ_005121 [Wickerhamomyces pijperi]
MLFLLSTPASGQMQSLYSPSYGRAYLKLSTNEVLPIDYNSTTVTLLDNESISSASVISPPTTGNYTLALVNGELYAFFAMVGDKTGTMAISKLYQDSLWLVLSYTSVSKILYFDYPTVMTSINNGTESVFIYGGVLDNGITTRMLEFNPQTKNLTVVSTSSSPTAFYGGANCALDSTGVSNLIIGGKAGTGWLSMFQIATWEYKTWSFKAVQSSSFNVNSRINPLVLPVFKQNDQQQDLNDVGSVMIIGGTIGGRYSSPYVLSLNVTNDWNYQNFTNIGDFQFSDSLIGAIVVNDTLITVSESQSASSSKKRSTTTQYIFNLYNVANMLKVSSFLYANAASLSSSSLLYSSSVVSSSSSTVISSSASQASTSSSLNVISSTTSSAAVAPSSTVVKTTKHTNTTPIIVGVVVPILLVIILATAGWFIYKKYFGQKNIELHSINSSNRSVSEPDYFKEVRNLEKEEEETHSISSWEHKRTEFQEQLQNQSQNNNSSDANNSQDSIFGQSNHSRDSVPLAHSPNPVSPSRKKKWRQSLTSLHSSHNVRPTLEKSPSKHQINLNLDELENNSTISSVSPSGHLTNRASFRLKKVSDEDEEIDEFLGDRDVQVLVSSKRRTKLRITNPDLEMIDSVKEDIEEETEYESIVGSSVVGSSISGGNLSFAQSSSASNNIFSSRSEDLVNPFYQSLIRKKSTSDIFDESEESEINSESDLKEKELLDDMLSGDDQ